MSLIEQTEFTYAIHGPRDLIRILEPRDEQLVFVSVDPAVGLAHDPQRGLVWVDVEVAVLVGSLLCVPRFSAKSNIPQCVLEYRSGVLFIGESQAPRGEHYPSPAMAVLSFYESQRRVHCQKEVPPQMTARIIRSNFSSAGQCQVINFSEILRRIKSCIS